MNTYHFRFHDYGLTIVHVLVPPKDPFSNAYYAGFIEAISLEDARNSIVPMLQKKISLAGTEYEKRLADKFIPNQKDKTLLQILSDTDDPPKSI